MPRVPRVQTETGRVQFTPPTRIGAPAALGQSVAQASAQAFSELEAFNERLLEARRKDLFIEKSSEFNRGLTALQLEADDPAQFRVAADGLLDTIVGDVSDTDLARVLRERGTFAIDSANATVSTRIARQQRDDARQKLSERILPEYSESIARAENDGNDVEAKRQLREITQFVQLSDHYTDEEKAELLASLTERKEVDRINLLIEQALADPTSASRLLNQASALLEKTLTPNIAPQSRLMLRRSIERVTTVAEARTKAAILQQARDSSDDFLRRIVLGNDDDMPSQREILESTMTRAEKEHFLTLLDQHFAGEDVSKDDPFVVNRLLERIHDPAHPEPIVRVEQLVPFLGEGLGARTFESLRADIDRKSSAETKPQEKQFSDFIRSQKASMVTPSIVPNSDPLGETLYNDFTLEARRLWLDGLAKGKTSQELLRSDSPDFIGRIVPQFQKGALEKSRAAFRIIEPGPFSVEREPGAQSVAPARENESAVDYYNRVILGQGK